MSGLCPRRNFQQRAAINGRDFDFRAQSGFGGGDGYCDLNVITISAEDRMVSCADDDVKIPRLASVRPRISFARDSDALAVASSCLDAHFERLSAADHTFSMTDWAG